MKVDLTTLLISLVLAGGASARPMYVPHYAYHGEELANSMYAPHYAYHGEELANSMYAPHYPYHDQEELAKSTYALYYPYHEEELAKSVHHFYQHWNPNLWYDWPTQYHHPPHPLMPGGQIAAPEHSILGLQPSWYPQQANNGLAPLSQPPVPDIPAVRKMSPGDIVERLQSYLANDPEEAPEKELFQKFTYIQDGVETPLFNAVVLENSHKAMLHIEGLSRRPAQYRIWLPWRYHFLQNEVHEIPYGITDVYEVPLSNNGKGSEISPPVIHFSGFKEVQHIQPDPASVYPQRFFPELPSDEKPLSPVYLEEDVE